MNIVLQLFICVWLWRHLWDQSTTLLVEQFYCTMVMIDFRVGELYNKHNTDYRQIQGVTMVSAANSSEKTHALISDNW